MKLQDEKLFRQHCYIDGEWVARLEGRTTLGQHQTESQGANKELDGVL